MEEEIAHLKQSLAVYQNKVLDNSAGTNLPLDFCRRQETTLRLFAGEIAQNFVLIDS